MVNEDLVAQIRARYQQGERRADMKAALMEQGWDEAQIDDAIAHIQHDALRQVPGLSHIYDFIDHWDQKTQHSSPKVIVGILAASFLLIVIISACLYFFLDPLGVQNVDRDKQRETDIVKVRTAIDGYYASQKSYPETLQGLVPKYLQAVPLDPKTGAGYTYRTLNQNQSYELCVNFEAQPVQCLTSSGTPIDDTIPEVSEEAMPEQVEAPVIDTSGEESAEAPTLTPTPGVEVLPLESEGL